MSVCDDVRTFRLSRMLVWKNLQFVRSLTVSCTLQQLRKGMLNMIHVCAQQFGVCCCCYRWALNKSEVACYWRLLFVLFCVFVFSEQWLICAFLQPTVYNSHTVESNLLLTSYLTWCLLPKSIGVNTKEIFGRGSAFQKRIDTPMLLYQLRFYFSLKCFCNCHFYPHVSIFHSIKEKENEFKIKFNTSAQSLPFGIRAFAYHKVSKNIWLARCAHGLNERAGSNAGTPKLLDICGNTDVFDIYQRLKRIVNIFFRSKLIQKSQ